MFVCTPYNLQFQISINIVSQSILELQNSLSSQNSLKFNFKNILEKRFFDWKPLSSIFGDRDAVSKYLKSVPPWPPSSTMIWPLREKIFSQVFLFVWQRKIKSGPTWIQAILYLAYTSTYTDMTWQTSKFPGLGCSREIHPADPYVS